MGLRILITNDDGMDAPGIAIMADIARALSDDVWIVAPDGNQSGAGHRLSFGHELTIEQRASRTYAIVGGSPADCVVAGMTHLLGDRPAWMITRRVAELQGANLLTLGDAVLNASFINRRLKEDFGIHGHLVRTLLTDLIRRERPDAR